MEIKNDCLEKKNDTDEQKIALPGFRFHPTDEELVTFYLRRKVENKSISIEIIKEIDVYKFDPWDLPRVSSVGMEKEWYFFSLRGRKYRNSIRPNRVTGSGFWKATGIDRPIMNSGSDNNDTCIGLKKSLVYYIGSAGKGKKTDWMMHEFRLPSNTKDTDTCSPSMQEAEIWTICRIFKRNICSKKAYKQTAASTSIQTATDSSSKTNSSVDSDHTNNQDQNSVLNPNQIYAAQYINQPFILHSPVSTTNSHQYSNNSYMNICGNWDELGRIVDYCMIDHATTAASQDSPYC